MIGGKYEKEIILFDVDTDPGDQCADRLYGTGGCPDTECRRNLYIYGEISV